MIYKGENLDTMGKLFEKAQSIPDSEAQEFLTCYVSYIVNSRNMSIEEATQIAKSNLGYYAGYYSNDVRKKIEAKFNCVHPIFGHAENPVSNEMAFALGQKGITSLFKQPK